MMSANCEYSCRGSVQLCSHSCNCKRWEVKDEKEWQSRRTHQFGGGHVRHVDCLPSFLDRHRQLTLFGQAEPVEDRPELGVVLRVL